MFLLKVLEVKTMFFIEVLLVILKEKRDYQILLGQIKLFNDTEEARFLSWPWSPGRHLSHPGCRLRRGIQGGRKCTFLRMAAYGVSRTPLTHTSTPRIVPFPDNIFCGFDLRNISENTMYLVLVLEEKNVCPTHTSK